MIVNERVLEEGTVPDRELVVHRQRALRRLDASLDPDDTDATVTYLLGPMGAGKTTCGRLALEAVPDESRVAFVDCREHYERFDVLYATAETLLPDVPPRRSTDADELRTKLDTRRDAHAAVVLDEADLLPDKRVFDDLAAIADLHLVLVADGEDTLFAGVERADPGGSRSPRRVEVDAYSTRELVDILAKRAEYALDDSPLTDEQLALIAVHADGDARVAIHVLRVAVERAIEKGHRTITDERIEDAVPHAKRQLRTRALNRLIPHQRAVHELVEKTGPVRTNDLYERYVAIVDIPQNEALVRTYLSKLRQYLLVECDEDGERTYVAAR